jgi:hypothetical protein
VSNQPSGEEPEQQPPGWLPLIDFLAAGLDDFGSFPVFVRVIGLRLWSDYRLFRLVPLEALSVGSETWELRLIAPGLLRRNQIGTSPLTLAALVEQLRQASLVAARFKLVLSDEAPLSRAQLVALATRRGNEWAGPPLDQVHENQFVGMFDLPVRSLVPRPRSDRLELRARVFERPRPDA